MKKLSPLILLTFAFYFSSAQNPVADFSPGNTLVCDYSCITFTNLSTNATSWQWSFPGGNPDTSTAQNPPAICYSSSGSVIEVYNVTLIAINGRNRDTLTNVIEVEPPILQPSIIRSDDTLYCSTDPSYVAYQWYADTNLIQRATDTLIVVTQKGNYCVQVTDENGCTAKTCITTLACVPVITSSDTTTFCQGESVTLSVTVTDSIGGGYLWSNGATTQSIVVKSSGNYFCNANTRCGIATSNTIIVTVNPAEATINPSGATTFCEGSMVTLTASSGISYLWSNGATTPSITVATSEIDSVTITNPSGCSATSSSTAVTVNPNSLITSQPQNQNVNSGDNAKFSVAAVGNNPAYQWQANIGFGFNNLSNAGAYSGVTTDTLTINGVNSSMNNYSFLCIISDALGCDTTSKEVVLTVITGVNENTLINSFNISPNPAVNQLTILTTSFYNEELMVSVLNVLGQEIIPPIALYKNIENPIIDISNLSAGIYFVQVVSEKGSWAGKFVKE